MATKHTLAAESRTTTGKGAARSLRRQGRVPAVIYGHHREPASLTVEAAALNRLITVGHGLRALLDISIDGKAPVKALFRELQRDPVRPQDIVHVDLYEVKADEKITVKVQLHLVGTADGVRNGGGILEHPMRELSVKCFPADIPEEIQVDVTDLAIGKSIHVREITVAKAEILDDGDLVVAAVVAPRVEEVAAPTADAAAAVAEPEVIKKGKEEAAEGEEAPAPKKG
ncbi:MAG TPA: 50S ribosomal protein L25 [Gemmatimonadales bacterium]|nr:50S ribosomal protein L25 [Gemmatimonadales bacterium]